MDQISQIFQSVTQMMDYPLQVVLEVHYKFHDYLALVSNQCCHDHAKKRVISSILTKIQSNCESCLPCFCEGLNVYDLVSIDKEGSPIEDVGIIQEKSTLTDRLCCQQFRTLKLHTSTATDNDTPIIKSCGFTCSPLMGGCCLFNGCPCARPEIILTRNNTSIGRITNPYRCMGRNGNHCAWEELDIIDDKGNIKYMISSSCCQSGQICRSLCLCRSFCNSTSALHFRILDASQNEVGVIVNLYNGFCTELCTKQDQFLINFPLDATYNDKILLINAVIMIDFDLFEDTCCKLA